MTALQALAKSFVLALCFAAPLAFSQAGGTTGSGSSTGKPTPPGVTPRQLPQAPQEQRMIFLRGNVRLDDGTKPSDRVAIERVCNGRVRRESYADASGYFSFQLGANPEMFQDASQSGFEPATRSAYSPQSSDLPGMTAGTPSTSTNLRDLMNCELRASLPGFISDSIPLSSLALFDSNTDVGTIVLHRMGKVEGTRISVTSLKAPKEAKKAFERGLKRLKEHKQAEAANEFSKAVALYPQYAEASARLGEMYAEQGRDQEAAKLFQQAIAADAKFIPPYLDLGMLAARKQDWNQVAELSEHVLALDAYQYPAAYYFNAVANFNLHKIDVAEKNARAARRLDSQYHIPRIDVLMANILLERGDYNGAAEQLRSFLKHEPSGPAADSARELLGRTEQVLASAPRK